MFSIDSYVPTGHHILIKVTPPETKSKGNIITITDDLKDSHQRAKQIGEVVSLGFQAYKGFDDGSPWCQPGDMVHVTRYSGEGLDDVLGFLEYEDENGCLYRVINDEDVLGIIKLKKVGDNRCHKKK